MRVRALVPLAPLRLPGFRNLFVATLASSLGSLLAAIALAIDVKDRTDSGLWVGAVLVVELLPTVAVGLLFGPFLDRLDRRSLMVAADLLRAAVFAALPFAGSAPAIVGLALLAGLATGFFRPAVFAGVPNLVPDEQLPQANALLQTIENASWMLGPALGGLLTAAAGPSAAYGINAVSFLISAVLVLRIPARLLQSEKALTRGHWRDLGDGFLAVLRARPLLAVLVGWGAAQLAVGAANVAEVFIAKDTFSAGDFGYGLLYSAIGAGLVLGSFLSTAALERLGTARTFGASMLVMAAGFAATAASPDVWVAAACVFVVGAGNGCAVTCNGLLVQRGIEDATRGRALTFVMSAVFLLVGAGTAAGGAALPHVGPRWIWAGGAGVLVLAAAGGYLLARGSGETAPGPAVASAAPAAN